MIIQILNTFIGFILEIIIISWHSFMDNYRQRDNAAYERKALRLLHSLGGECVGFVVHLSFTQKANMWKVW